MKNGYLGKSIGNLNRFGIKLLKNVAPVLPDETLRAIERTARLDRNNEFLTRNNNHCIEFARLLRLLAYDSMLFKRCTRLLCQISLTEDPDERNNSVSELFSSLFSIYFSGTHASIEDRAEIINSLVSSSDPDKETIGFKLLNVSLKTSHFSSRFSFEFGARSRDFGFCPKNRDQVVSWYQIFIGICVQIAKSDMESSIKARRLLANNFRGLWSNAKMYDVLEASAKEIHELRSWNEGWIAVKGIIRFDNKGFSDDVKSRIQVLERLLSPDSLLERARTYAISDQRLSFGLEDDPDESEASSGWLKAEVTAQELGKQVASEENVFRNLLPELVTSESPRVGFFGRGLAEGVMDKELAWGALYRQFEGTSPEDRNISILNGYLSACKENDPIFHDQKLDQLVDDPILGEWFPILQIASGIDHKGLGRLYQSLEIDRADIFIYERLAWGRVHEDISDDNLVELLKRIARCNDGVIVVTEILNMRFYRTKGDAREFNKSLIEFSCKILAEYPFESSRRRGELIGYKFEVIAKECLKGNLGKKYIRLICQNIASAIDNYYVDSFDLSKFLSGLAALYPEDFLDIFVGDSASDKSNRWFTYFDGFDNHENPLDSIPNEIVIHWCRKNRQVRCPLIACFATPYFKNIETESIEWRPYISDFLNSMDDLNSLFDALAESLIPQSWSGSRADIMESRLPLLESLCEHENQEVSTWAKYQHSEVVDLINRERELESDRIRRDESFE